MDWPTLWRHIEHHPGWLAPGEAHWLYQTAQKLPADALIVEIGAYAGKSTCCLAAACEGTQRRVISIDTWQIGGREDYDRILAETGLSEHVTAITGQSSYVLSDWRHGPAGLVFIDGDHRYPGARTDVLLAYDLLREGGYLAMHDVVETWPGVSAAWYRHAARLLGEVSYTGTLAAGRKPYDAARLPVWLVSEPGEPGNVPAAPALMALPFRWQWWSIEPTEKSPVFDRLHAALPSRIWQLPWPRVVALNAVLTLIHEPVVLWVVDPSAVTPERMSEVRQVFLETDGRCAHPECLAWRACPGVVWQSHEPLQLAEPSWPEGVRLSYDWRDDMGERRPDGFSVA